MGWEVGENKVHGVVAEDPRRGLEAAGNRGERVGEKGDDGSGGPGAMHIDAVEENIETCKVGVGA